MSSDALSKSGLGKETKYTEKYEPSLLYPVPRKIGRERIGLGNELPFKGVDIWNAYELSWLDCSGKPQVAIMEFILPYTSPNLVESKSIKLYLNSFTMTQFKNIDVVKKAIIKDLSDASGGQVDVILIAPSCFETIKIQEFSGKCIDGLDVSIDCYTPNPSFLTTESNVVQEALVSRLLKSNCPVTGQPDWATVQISYKGKKINEEGLLKYIVSFREHQGFHEQCVENIFVDIMKQCNPKELTVYARYTRRGGLDINPFRTNTTAKASNLRLVRQ